MVNRSYIFAITTILCVSIAYSFDACKVLFDTPRNFSKTDLYFKVKEKTVDIEEHSLRKGKTSAHIYLDYLKKKLPYFFVAFPAGNSGIGVWFKSTSSAKLEVTSKPVDIHHDANPKEELYAVDGLHGVEFYMRSGAKELSLGEKDLVLGSMRFVREREIDKEIPPEIQKNKIELIGNILRISRPSLNELASYLLEIEGLEGTEIRRQGNSYIFTSKTEVKLKISTLTGEKPVTPLSLAEIFLEEALRKIDPDQLEHFAFLFYREKLVAGSPRYFSKFGRDSIYTFYVMMDLMKPEAIESLLSATLSSMDPATGLISHEQSEGDFVSWENMKSGRPYKGISKPSEDYKMKDNEYAYAIAFGKYAQLYPKRVSEFLMRKDARGIIHEKLIRQLFSYIMVSTKNFAYDPVYKNLISLLPGEKVGEWRDSENGLAGGRYPFDVNAALVPGALKAMISLGRFFNENEVSDLKYRYRIWNTKVIPLFEVRTEKVSFPAISLDKEGNPIPIMHSDDSFVLAFGNPSESYLRAVSDRIRFLATPVGIPVADARFANSVLKEQFDNTKYHGYVSWTMVENMILFGLHRQYSRTDISKETKTQLRESWNFVKRLVDSKGAGEVFAINFVDGKYEAKPLAGDAKSNSNQLWSHWSLIFAFLTFK